MNRLLLVLLALGAVVLGVVWFSVSSRETGRGSAVWTEASPPAEAAAKPAEALAPGKTVEPAPANNEDSAVAPSASAEPPAREVVASSYEEELARGHWVEGRVLFPEGTPADEELFVVARGKDFEHGDLHKTKVEPDGRFRVAFSTKTKTGKLAIEARYLYLEKDVRWKHDEAAGPIALEPKLGGRIVGRLVPPADVPATAIGGSVQLFARDPERPMSTSEGVPVEIKRDLSYELDQLHPEWEYEIGYTGEAFVCSPVELDVAAGKTRTQDLERLVGVRIRGRTVDDTGTPLPGVHVSADSHSLGTWSHALGVWSPRM